MNIHSVGYYIISSCDLNLVWSVVDIVVTLWKLCGVGAVSLLYVCFCMMARVHSYTTELIIRVH